MIYNLSSFIHLTWVRSLVHTHTSAYQGVMLVLRKILRTYEMDGPPKCFLFLKVMKLR